MNRIVTLFAGMLLLLAQIVSATGKWNQIGPPATNVTRVVPDRQHQNVWYLLADAGSTGRLYVSSDTAANWNLAQLRGVTDVAVHPKSSEVFVLTTGVRTQIWRSSNLGKSFEKRASLPFDLHGIRLDPFNPDRIYGFGFDEWGVAVSNDAGRGWSGFNNLPYKPGKKFVYGCVASGYYFEELVVSPFDPETLFASGSLYGRCGSFDYVVLHFLIKSATAGKTWLVEEKEAEIDGYEYPLYRFHTEPLFPNRILAIGLQNIKRLEQHGWKTISAIGNFSKIVAVPGDPNQLLAISEVQYDGARPVYKSDDGGTHWRETEFFVPKGLQEMESVPDGLNGFFAGTDVQGVFYRNSSHGWKPSNNGILDSSITRVFSAPGLSSVYAIAERRFDGPETIYRRDSDGKWTNLGHKIPPLQIDSDSRDGAINPKNPENLIIEARRGYLVTFDSGNSWQKVPLNISSVAFDPNQSEQVYFTSGTSLYKSQESGLNPKKVSERVPKQAFNVVLDPNNSSVLFVLAGTGLFKSADGGRHFRELRSGLLSCDYDFPRSMVPLGKKDVFLLSTGCGDVYKSFNGGDSWELLARNLPAGYGTKIGSADSAGNHLFLGSGDLLESTDGGRTWKNISSEIDPRFRGQRRREGYVWDMTNPSVLPFYIATNLGVFETTSTSIIR